MELTKRLKWIADTVEPGSVAADVGTDHGYIPVYLALEGRVSKAYAMDVNKGPLEKARRNIEEAGMQSKVIPLLSDGLEKLEDQEVDTVIIAGMGGMLIRRILMEGQHNLSHVRKLILSPHLDLEAVRRTVMALGYPVGWEDMMIDSGKMYTLMVCEKMPLDDNEIYKTSWSDQDFRYGKSLIEQKHPLLKMVLSNQLKTHESVLKQLQDSTSESGRERLTELTGICEEIREVLSWL